jgi:hypothetical protein
MTGTWPDRRSRPDRRKGGRRRTDTAPQGTHDGLSPNGRHPEARFAAQVIGQMLEQESVWMGPERRRR